MEVGLFDSAAPASARQLSKYYRWLFANLNSSLGSHRSAECLAPIIVELIRPNSVIDVGCGLGNWLVVLQASGVDDVLGVDGDHLDVRQLRIPPEKFIRADLKDRLKLDRKFDLALCLEVAGYVDPSGSENLVRTLTDAAPIVLFSSAIPFQDNEKIQINQHWQEYWAELFLRRDFVPIDCIRKRIWHNDEISWWYRQNAILYVHKDELDANEALRLERERDPGLPMCLVHPEHYLLLQAELRKSLVSRALTSSRSALGRALPPPIRSAFRKFRAKASPAS
jgi:SAM-dependent methyltransferase